MFLLRESLVLVLCAWGFNVFADPIRIAVIDTGIDLKYHDAPLCNGLSQDLTGAGLNDTNGHGSHISDLIDQYTKNRIRTREDTIYLHPYEKINYCQVILKWYDDKATALDNLNRSAQAFQIAVDDKVDVINYSAGGSQFSNEEFRAIRTALDAGIKVVVAAGNDGQNFDHPEIEGYTYYPALYDKRIIVVGNLDNTGTNIRVQARSNYGSKVTQWEIGTRVLGLSLNNYYQYYTGTSQACGIASGKLIHSMLYYKQDGK
jgi:thermitase